MTNSCSSKGAWIGGLVGFNAWILCLGVWSAIAGELATLLPVVLITLATTLALSLEYIALVEIRERLGPSWRAATSTLLTAAVLTSLGIVGLLCKYWIIPAANEATGLREISQRFGGLQDYPLWIAVGPLLFALILWMVGVGRIMRMGSNADTLDTPAQAAGGQ